MVLWARGGEDEATGSQATPAMGEASQGGGMSKQKKITYGVQELRDLAEKLGKEWYGLHESDESYARGGRDMAKHVANRIIEHKD